MMGKKSFCGWIRWIHLYLSMFSFAALLFFALTGITLNHPSWTENRQKVEMLEGNVDLSWIAGTDTSLAEKSAIVDHLKKEHNIRGRLTEFRVSESECSLAFDGPGFTAYGMIDRTSGSYELVATSAGIIAAMNDLHKGSYTGSGWNTAIDIIAAILIVISLTGFIMIFYMTKKRSKGLWVAIFGALTFVVLCILLG
ncbi:MAG TPA: PepSY-associated TM helix domain-containing protein [Bacteroidales bacterium]|nr:PepSY-associated TM helix domain-containing protein [Bacteroidales bacterium]HPX43881.1 PepSY-associated TM helix domain-containing protein [Bacteroidales bacterium]